jgi:transposase
VITDAHGTPLAVRLTGGNRHDVTQLLPLLDAIPHVKGRTGRPRHRPRQLFADRGYDFDKYRRLLWKRGIKPVIARRGMPHGSGLGTVRWVVSARMPGSMASADCGSVGSSATTSTKHSSNWPAA